MDCSPPGSCVHGILQARVLEWIAMPSSRGSSQPRDHSQVSHVAGGIFTIRATRETQKALSRPLERITLCSCTSSFSLKTRIPCCVLLVSSLLHLLLSLCSAPLPFCHIQCGCLLSLRSLGLLCEGNCAQSSTGIYRAYCVSCSSLKYRLDILKVLIGE